MSHHTSGPNFGFPRGDARLDLTDFYAFPKPAGPGKSILVFNVHPSVGLNPPGPTTKEPFAPGALYEIKIDTNGDAIADICYSTRFCVLRRREADRDAAPYSGPASRGDVRRRRSYRRGSTGLRRAGSPGDESRRLPPVCGLAQRSFLLRRKRPVQQNAVHGRRLLRRQKCLQHRA